MHWHASDARHARTHLEPSSALAMPGPLTRQDVEIIVVPIPRLISTWLIGIGKLISKLIRLKVPRQLAACDTAPVLAHAMRALPESE